MEGLMFVLNIKSQICHFFFFFILKEILFCPFPKNHSFSYMIDCWAGGGQTSVTWPLWLWDSFTVGGGGIGSGIKKFQF